VAGRATGQYVRALNLVLLNKIYTLGNLLIVPVLNPPVHIEDLVFGSHESFRIPVTGKTPFHLERCKLVSERHLVYRTMTGRTSNTLIHMNAVIEIGEIGKVVYPRPFDRLARTPTLAHRLEIWAVRPYLRVAVHTRTRGRDTGRCGPLDIRVAIAAVDSVVARMVFMAKLDRLFAIYVCAGDPGRTVDLRNGPNCGYYDKDRSEDSNFSQRISAVMKDLRHLRAFYLTSSRTYSVYTKME
jgi:hypothetical protein